MVVKNCDIAIIGGGIQGLFLAYYSKIKFPQKKIFLFESKVIGSGTTSYSGHLHSPYGEGDKYFLTKTSLSLYNELLKRFPDFPIERRDFTGICLRKDQDKILSKIINKDDISINITENISSDYISFSGLKGFVTRRSITTYMMELIIKMGVVIFEGSKVESIVQINDNFQLTTIANQKIMTSIVINSSGISLFNLLEKEKINLRIKKVVAFHIDELSFESSSINYFFDDDAFILPQPYYSRYLFSYNCEEWYKSLGKGSGFPSIKSKDILAAQKVLRKYYNSSINFIGGQVHLDLYNTPSSSPLIYEFKKNYITVGATGGSGVRLAPALAIKAINKLAFEFKYRSTFKPFRKKNQIYFL